MNKEEFGYLGEANQLIQTAEHHRELKEVIASILMSNDKLQQENQALKKQLEEYKRLGFKHLNDKCNKLENQQKEFIEYLEEEMKKNINWYNSLTPHDKNYYYKDYVDKDTNYMVVLSKYKEIIGGK